MTTATENQVVSSISLKVRYEVTSGGFRKTTVAEA